MAIYNKQGDKFEHKVVIPKDPNTDPTYSHTFPVQVGNRVEERWTSKVRPIKDMTRVLQANHLKRNIDYMVDYNGINKEYEYWFKDDVEASMFKLISAGVVQKLGLPGAKFKIKCPCCGDIFSKSEIEWVK